MTTECEHINPYADDPRSKTEQVREMFDHIAPAYDFMNRAMTFGIDRRWRRKAVKMLAAGPHARVLDVAAGTGDMAMLIARLTDAASIEGIDLSEGMIEVGRRKIERAALQERITLRAGDCLHLPYPDASFDAISVAYGVRNFADLAAGFREMLRVLRPGGTLTVIELSTPTSPIVRPFYRLYTRHIIPLAGRLVSKDVRAYSYLPESIAAVPQGERMTALMSEAGFSGTRHRPLTFGTCTIYTAKKS